MFSNYKDIFGKPHEGFHKNRLFGLAINDVIGTILIGLLISYYFNIDIKIVSMCLLISVILIHRLFGVDTALNVMIFGSNNN